MTLDLGKVPQSLLPCGNIPRRESFLPEEPWHGWPGVWRHSHLLGLGDAMFLFSVKCALRQSWILPVCVRAYFPFHNSVTWERTGHNCWYLTLITLFDWEESSHQSLLLDFPGICFNNTSFHFAVNNLHNAVYSVTHIIILECILYPTMVSQDLKELQKWRSLASRGILLSVFQFPLYLKETNSLIRYLCHHSSHHPCAHLDGFAHTDDSHYILMAQHNYS